MVLGLINYLEYLFDGTLVIWDNSLVDWDINTKYNPFMGRYYPVTRINRKILF